MELVDPAAPDPSLRVYAEDNVDCVEESIRVEVYGQELSLSLLLKEDELAPLFSGAAWAGTLLWDAAVFLTRHFLAKYKSELSDPTNRLRVIELGAGIGVPGMAARVAGAHSVTITEQPDLVELMERNLDANAKTLRLDTIQGSIIARVLSWGIEETQTFLTQSNTSFDVILSCDCIYEPLYGTSWRALADTMQVLCLANPSAIVIMGVERRNQDGIDSFLSYIHDKTQLTCTFITGALGMKQNKLQVYYLHLSTLDDAILLHNDTL